MSTWMKFNHEKRLLKLWHRSVRDILLQLPLVHSKWHAFFLERLIINVIFFKIEASIYTLFSFHFKGYWYANMQYLSMGRRKYLSVLTCSTYRDRLTWSYGGALDQWRIQDPETEGAEYIVLAWFSMDMAIFFVVRGDIGGKRRGRTW